MNGINEDYKKKRPRIERWGDGSWKTIGNTKRAQLNIHGFRYFVLDHYSRKQPCGKFLQFLAAELYGAIFCNPKVEKKGCGYKTGTFACEEIYDDPLPCRTNEEDV